MVIDSDPLDTTMRLIRFILGYVNVKTCSNAFTPPPSRGSMAMAPPPELPKASEGKR